MLVMLRQRRLYRWLPYLLVAICMLPVMILRDFTPANELRYLSIADESIARHTFFAFYNHGEVYADKPPLYFWIVMLGKLLFGKHCMWFLSLFSLIPAFVIAEVMDRWSAPVLSPHYRFAAKMLLLTCGLFAGMEIFLRMDMLMTMFIVLAFYSFRRIREGGERAKSAKTISKHQWLFPLWIFLGIFTKGPMAILIPLIATIAWLVYRKELRTIGRYWGWRTWLVLMALCGVWFTMVWVDGGREYLNNLLFHQTVDRAVDSFHHKRPFYWYLLTLPYCVAPWTLLIFGALIVSFVKNNRMKGDMERFFLTVILSTLVLLSAISSKIAVYMLPAYPFMAYLAAICLSRYGCNCLTQWGVGVPACLLGLAGAAAMIVASLRPELNDLGIFVWLAAVVLLLGSVWTMIVLFGKKSVHGGVTLLAVTLLVAVFAAGLGLPRINSRLGYGELTRKAVEMSAGNPDARYISWRLWRADNLDVYLHRDFTLCRADSDSIVLYEGLRRGDIVMMQQKHEYILPAGERLEIVKVGKRYMVVKKK